jgi:hypothetical protein
MQLSLPTLLGRLAKKTWVPLLMSGWCWYNVFTIDWDANPYTWPVLWANALVGAWCLIVAFLLIMFFPVKTRAEERAEGKEA